MRELGSVARGVLALAMVGGATAGGASGQADARGQAVTDQSVAARVEQARLAEQVERDFARAIELWRGIADDAKVAAEQRGNAWIAIARLRQRTGDAVAAKEALERATALGGATAEDARRLLADGLGDERMRERVDAAVQSFRDSILLRSAGDFDREKSPYSDVYWLGEATLIKLAQLVRESSDHTPLMSAVPRLIVAIGGEDAAAQVRSIAASPDVLLRRTLLESAKENRSEEPVRSALLVLARDPDARLRELALQGLMKLMTAAELEPYLTDREVGVRAEALQQLIQLEVSAAATTQRGFSPRLIAALRRAFDDSMDAMNRTLAKALSAPQLWDSAEGQELFLAAFADDRLHGRHCDNGWVNGFKDASDAQFGTGPTAARLLDLARAIYDEPIDTKSREQARRRSGFSNLYRRSFAAWRKAGATDVPALLEMGRVAGVDLLATWIPTGATLAELAAVCELMADQRAMQVGLIVSLLQRASELPSESQQRVVDALVEAAASSEGVAARDCVSALVLTRAAAGDRALVEMVRREPKWFVHAVGAAIGSNGSTVGSAALAELLLLPGAALEANAGWGSIESARTEIAIELARRGAPELIERIAAAARLGMANRRTQHMNRPMTALAALFVDGGVDAPNSNLFQVRWAPRYSIEKLERALRDCADVGGAGYWSDVQWLIRLIGETLDLPLSSSSKRGARIVQLPTAEAGSDGAGAFEPAAQSAAVSRVVGELLPRCLDAVDPEFAKALIAGYLEQRSPGWEAFAVKAFDNKRLRPTVFRSLPSLAAIPLAKVLAHESELVDSIGLLPGLLARTGDPALCAEILPLLSHANADVRRGAVREFAKLWPQQVVDKLTLLADDADASTRLAVVTALAESFDRQALPFLIERLRDADGPTRDAARKALEQLQYYFDSKSRWERLLSESGLDANTAAEALIKQSKSAATPELRRLAIDSLGTLKVPETLPFLIQLMSDKDPSIATAAKAAVVKING